MNKKVLVIIGIILLIVVAIVIIFKLNNIKSTSKEVNKQTEISLNINGKNYIVDLEQNNTVNELLNVIPDRLDMDELHGNEYYSYLDKALPTNSKNIKNIEVGDIMLYGNNCIVIFYESFETSYSYTKIGKIRNTSDLKENLKQGIVEIIK